VLVRFSELLAEAQARREAVGAFTCYNLETAAGVLRAAEERRRGAILLVSEKSFSAPGGRLLLAALVAAARASEAPACVELDHVRSLVPIRAAFELGAGAALADGSSLGFEENVELVRAAAIRGEVEAELGGIDGDEDVAQAVAAGALTDPTEAARFVEQSSAACLAVSIGNVHGVYREAPALDWPRLEQIARRVDVPLALHGASGLADEDLRRAIRLGIAKVNLNTELRQRYLEATEARLAAARDGANVLALNLAQAEAIAELVREKLDALSAARAG
jgi:tagatose 1,6-diphosphate aldolase GatY/KbaY